MQAFIQPAYIETGSNVLLNNSRRIQPNPAPGKRNSLDQHIVVGDRHYIVKQELLPV